MAAPNVTFPCPHCNRRMGVPSALLGRQVRCPHCKQVLVAPASAGPPPAPPPTPTPVIQIVPQQPNPQPPTPSQDLPVFNLPVHKEGTDSILGDPDESEDAVFGSKPSRGLRTFRQLETVTGLSTSTTNPPDENQNAARHDAADSSDPMPTEAPFVPQPAPPTGAAETNDSSLPPGPVIANPFSGLSSSSPLSVGESRDPATRLAERTSKAAHDTLDDETQTNPMQRGERETGQPAGSKLSSLLLIVLAVYAVVATGAAVYGLFFKPGGRFDTDHPLSTIPDNFGEFDPATRKKVSQYQFRVDGELPAAQRARLSEKLSIGQLEIEPKKIEKRPLRFEIEGSQGEKRQEYPGYALVLTLSIRNVSPDLNIFPMDPAFTRKSTAADAPITRLVVNKQTVFAGGAIPWPLPATFKKWIEIQQANDSVPLRPGESREYIVFTDARPEIVKAAETAKEAMQWRVEVRRGPIEVNGKEIPVTAIIGVDFTAADIKEWLPPS